MVLEKNRSLKARRPKNRPLATGGSWPVVADGKVYCNFPSNGRRGVRL